ncbi:MAG: hypothetical protein Salg2KO_13350 [Salibacteraceae bacterium]
MLAVRKTLVDRLNLNPWPYAALYPDTNTNATTSALEIHSIDFLGALCTENL